MVNFGDIPENTSIIRKSEAVSATLSKLGGPGATDVVLGTVFTPAVQLTTDLQFLSSRVGAPLGWDTSQDVTATAGFALNGLQSDSDTFDFDFSYQYVRPGSSGVADLDKPSTVLIPQLTVSSGAGLKDSTLYSKQFTLDRSDSGNPYSGESAGAFTFCININTSSSITTMNILGVIISFPVLY